MLRRTVQRQWFKKLRDGYNVNTLRVKEAPRNSGSDPVHNQNRYESFNRPMRKNRANESNVEENFLQGDEMSKWMDVEQAARILNIKSDELIGLKAARVEQAWAALYRANQFSSGKKNEVTSAAEILMMYVDSEMAQKKQRKYYETTLENMRLDIEREINSDYAKMWDFFYHGAGLAMLLGGIAIVTMAYVKRYAATANVIQALDSMNNLVKVSVARPPNVEPAPNYITRYRDTPTAIEVDRSNGITYDQSMQEVAMRHDLKATEREEDAFLLNMMNEENTLALREAKEAKQSTWKPHAAAGGEEGSNAVEGAASSSTSNAAAAPTMDANGNPIVLPITGKTVPRETYDPTLVEFVDTMESKYPSAMVVRTRHMLDRSQEQNATLERAALFKQIEEGEAAAEEGQQGNGV